MSKPVVKIGQIDLLTRAELEAKLRVIGIELVPYKYTPVVLAYKDGKRRKIHTCLIQLVPECGDKCCGEHIEIDRKSTGKTLRYWV